MINIYKTDNRIISEIDQYEAGAWVKLTSPTLEECAEVSDCYGMDIADVEWLCSPGLRPRGDSARRSGHALAQRRLAQPRYHLADSIGGVSHSDGSVSDRNLLGPRSYRA